MCITLFRPHLSASTQIKSKTPAVFSLHPAGPPSAKVGVQMQCGCVPEMVLRGEPCGGDRLQLAL